MTVSIWVMLVWLAMVFVSIYAIRTTIKNRKKNVNLEEVEFPKSQDEKIGLMVILLIVTIVSIICDLVYYITTSAVMGNIWFTFISALLIIMAIRNYLKLLSAFNKQLNGDKTALKKTKLTLFDVLKFSHIIYFGIYIFTGISFLP